MADALVSALVEKLVAGAIDQVGRALGVRSDLEKLHSELSAIQAVIQDAEERSVMERNVRDWVAKLKDAAYDVDYLLDEFQTDAEWRNHQNTAISNKAGVIEEMVNDAVDSALDSEDSEEETEEEVIQGACCNSWNYAMPLQLIGELYETCRKFTIRVSDYIRYWKITSNMNEHFTDATTEELNASDATCSICREEMITAKKLVCGHLFHGHCLRSWLEWQHTCPTCRALVVPAENRSAGSDR